MRLVHHVWEVFGFELLFKQDLFVEEGPILLDPSGVVVELLHLAVPALVEVLGHAAIEL
jgi:hypothetical protein